MRITGNAAVGLMAMLAITASTSGIAAEAIKPASDGPEGQKVFTELAAYYKDNKSLPPYKQALTELSAGEEATRTAAGKYVLALFKQLLADESNGRAPWRKTPFWGGGSVSDARELRKTVAKDFGEQAKGDAALDSVLWLINEEQLQENQSAGVQVLKKIDSPKIAAILKTLLAPHPNADIAAMAIEETARRKLTALAPEIQRLCTHYRTSVREAARRAAPALGVGNIPEYKPEAAYTPWLDGQMKLLADMILPGIPTDAKWSRFTLAAEKNQQEKAHEFSGWLLDEKDGNVHVLDIFGQEEELEKAKVTIASRTLAEDAAWTLEARKGKGREASEQLSRRGGLTGQFEPGFVSVPEALLAAWAYRRGDRKLAAELLFPRIDETKDDRWVFWAVRDMIGGYYHQQMLDAFTHERDYDKAITIAKHLSKPAFNDYNYQERAKTLAAQLEKRRDDFKAFALPTPTAWEQQKAKLSRAEQVKFLAEHLRLLNCIQWGQPGGIDFDEPQSSVAYAKQRAEALKHDTEMAKTPVINPYTELEKMDLQVSELPPLVPFIADENFIVAYSYWRDFHPARTLYAVSGLAANLIDSVAHQDIVRLGEFEELDEAGRKQHIEKILAWCKENAGKSSQELCLDVIERSGDWRAVQHSAYEAVAKKYVKAVPALIRRMNDFPKQKADLVEYIHDLAPSSAMNEARGWLSDADDAVKFFAALILIRSSPKGGKAEGLDVLQGILAKDAKQGDWYPSAVDDLLASGNEQAGETADAILEAPFLEKSWNKGPILQRLVFAGRRKAFDYLNAQLASDKESGKSSGTWKGQDVERKQTEADETAQMIARWRLDNYRYDTLAPDAERKSQRDELKKWLEQQAELAKAGKNPNMAAPEGKIDRPHWHVDAP